MTDAPIRVRIFYPADPLGVVPGGVDTFLRGLIKFAPPELEFSLVGMSTDPAARPVGRWQRCEIGRRRFDFYPVVAKRHAGGRGRVPLAVSFSAGVWRHMAAVHGGFDVFDFHRIEPSLLFGADGRPKNFYFHNDPQTLRLAASDNLWRHAPRAYEQLERRAMAGMSSAWCVRESGVTVLRERYPAQAESIRFIPTWVDPDVFHPVDPVQRRRLRDEQAAAAGLDLQLPWVISVGRLDTQKNPGLMLDAMQRLHAGGRAFHWLVIGDGVLRAELEQRVQTAGLSGQVRFLGLLAPAAIADWLRAGDVFALPSAYEGMPMALLEALGCGLPAAVTDVGEVRRVVKPGVNGAIAAGRDPQDVEAFTAALATVLDGAAKMGGEPAFAAAAAFRPGDVLTAAYDGYRALGEGQRTLRLAAGRARASAAAEGRRTVAVGIPIDHIDRNTARQRVLAWAEAHESRYVCFVNVHSSVHAARDERHRLALLAADLAAPDGAPVAWTVGAKARAKQQRVDGPGTMWQLCVEAAAQGIKVGLYGSSPTTLAALEQTLHAALPQLQLDYVHSPPFRELSPAEDDVVCAEIAAAGVGLLFVGLGCPRQERWMAAHRGRIPAVMLGVGAAFDFHAGTVARAPAWMRERGLEWLFRMGTHPQRLGPRYVHTNTLFLAKTAREATRSLVPRSAASSARQIDAHVYAALLSRIDARLPAVPGRVLGFIASSSGEGTSTAARACVDAFAARGARGVLLLQVLAGDSGGGLLEAQASGQSLGPLITPLLDGAAGCMGARLGGHGDASSIARQAEACGLWAELRCRFDEIVVDLPAASASALGLALAPHCDGILVLLQAGKTRAATVQRLLADLQMVGANVLGTVLNRSHRHIAASDLD